MKRLIKVFVLFAAALCSFWSITRVQKNETHLPAEVGLVTQDSNPTVSEAVKRHVPVERVPRDLNIAFLGDSVSRFAYISLAYYLQNGRWIRPAWTQRAKNPSFAKSFPGGDPWLEYNKFVNGLLVTSEVCDCYRGEFDARYFYDVRRNNRLSFFFRGGHAGPPFRGRIESSHVWQSFRTTPSMPFGNEESSPHLWEHYNWDDFIREELGTMEPKPDIVVLNAGLWRNNFSQPQIRNSILDALREIGVQKTVWRTTSYIIEDFDNGNNQTKLNHGDAETDLIMCDLLDYCADISFTAKTHRDYFNDYNHFKEPVNRAINEAILDTLGLLPSTYERFNVSILSEPYRNASDSFYKTN